MVSPATPWARDQFAKTSARSGALPLRSFAEAPIGGRCDAALRGCAGAVGAMQRSRIDAVLEPGVTCPALRPGCVDSAQSRSV